MSQKTVPTVRVPTDPDTCRQMGRNGYFPIQAIEIWGAVDRLFIDGISRRGTTINGGFHITPEVMDLIAREWLRAREAA